MPGIGMTAIIGAGPYGLAASAYLKAAGLPVLTFGKPLELWRNMPEGLCLKSVWSASHLADPDGLYTLDRYLFAHGLAQPEPIPRSFFLDYGRWFQEQVGIRVDETYVQMLARDGRAFRLLLSDGREVQAERVVVGTGVAPFMRIPDYARHLPGELVAHTQQLKDLTGFHGKRVVMVGRGQSALEYAALLNEAGADVEIIARGSFIWHSRVLYERVGPARHIFYPPGDVGPPGINWIVAFPGFFSRLPERLKQPLHQRAIRPAGARWLRSRVEGVVRLTPDTSIIEAREWGKGLKLQLSDGTQRTIDRLVLGTGYQPDINHLDLLDPLLISQIETRQGYPVLNSAFASSVPNLHFVGALAGQTFGPVCRFLSGAHIPARQITRYATQAA